MFTKFYILNIAIIVRAATATSATAAAAASVDADVAASATCNNLQQLVHLTNLISCQPEMSRLVMDED